MNYHLIILFIQFFLVTLKGHDNEVKNIMLIGRTGNGKSTLANVLVNKNNELEEVFEEVSGGSSGTKDTQNEIFEVNHGSKKVKYRIIDTVGLGDTRVTTKEVLKKIANTIPFIKEGLYRIFFVINGRFTKEEIKAYNLLKDTIFDDEVVKYTTIINPRFPGFQNVTACEEDCSKMENETSELADIIESSTVFIHVNTPPLEGELNMVNAHKEARKASRQKLIDHLNDCQGIYHPSNLDDFKERVWNYLSEEEKTKIELKEAREREEKERKQREEERKRREEAERESDRQKKRREEAERESDRRRNQIDELIKRRESGQSSSREIGGSLFSVLGAIVGGIVAGPPGAIAGAGAGAGLGQLL